MTTLTTSDAQTDLALLERIARRDATAVAELYDRQASLLYSVILRILKDKSEAEDVLQEVLLSVWKRAETYDAALGTPTAWLVRIARNRAIDTLRLKQARANVDAPSEIDLAAAPMPDRGPDPETSAVLSRERQAVKEALSSLSSEQRQLIEEAFFLGYTHSELAARFRLPLGTVKTRIRTGMLALRQRLQHLS